MVVGKVARNMHNVHPGPLLMQRRHCIGVGAGPAGPVLAGSLFRRFKLRARFAPEHFFGDLLLL